MILLGDTLRWGHEADQVNSLQRSSPGLYGKKVPSMNQEVAFQRSEAADLSPGPDFPASPEGGNTEISLLVNYQFMYSCYNSPNGLSQTQLLE